MATLVQGTSKVFSEQITFRPQSFTSTGAGLTCNVYPFGANMLSARLDVGAVNTFTSLVVKIQASTDNSNWDDISGAVFTTVTAANAGETIDFLLPQPASATASPYIYVRAYATLVGTSAVICCVIRGNIKQDAASGYVNTPQTNN